MKQALFFGLVGVASALMACSGTDDSNASRSEKQTVTEEAGGVGRPCEADSDCPSELRCNVDLENYVGHGQCTDRCWSTEECESAHGEVTMCIGANICVAQCIRASDCPEKTRCSTNGWCERAGEGSGNPYCVGTPLSCGLLTPSDCGRALGCHSAGGCGGMQLSCGSMYDSYSCESQGGCYWSSSTRLCDGTAMDCSYYVTDYDCRSQEGCYFDESCTGTLVYDNCEELSVSACVAAPGCKLAY